MCREATGVDAVRACTKIIEANDVTTRDITWAYVRRAEAHFTADKLSNALEDISSAIARSPGQARLYAQRGRILGQMRHYDGALADFDAADGLQPDSVFSLNGRGLVYQMLGQYDRAIKVYTKA
ncbi:MAG: hypothetical protein OER56_03350, partial [Hyphomicrobiales bacterium]|nr:hypothetical protein [Hyphomicrobiales bacterium]